MTKEEAAARLDGSEYGREGSRELWAEMKTADPLYVLCRAFIEKHRVSCPEATVEDRVYEHAPDLVEEIGRIVGFYRYPDEVA